MLWHRQAIFESKADKLSSSAECRIRTQRVSETQSPAHWMPADKPTELSRIKLKTWTRQPIPIISKHSAHLTLLPFGIGTRLWRIHICCFKPGFWSAGSIVTSHSVGNSCQFTSPRLTTLEEDRELFVHFFFSFMLMIWDSRHEDLQLFDRVLNTDQPIRSRVRKSS